MSFVGWLQKFFVPRRSGAPPSIGADTRAGDTAAICDLARQAASGAEDFSSPFSGACGDVFTEETSDASIALGTLFREQGDFAQAVRLREVMLSRPGTSARLRARTLFELGRDYKQAGLLDRALLAYKDARKSGYPEQAIKEDLCQLYADSGDFSSAAEHAEELGNLPAQAHYFVRQAEEAAATGKDDMAAHLLRKALSRYPGSPEARLVFVRMFLLDGAVEKALAETKAGLGHMTEPGCLIFLEGLYSFVNGPSALDSDPDGPRALYSGLCDVLAARKPDIALCYYAGLFLQAINKNVQAEQWFTKALVLDPAFWAARLALLSLAAEREDLPPLLAEQIQFFRAVGARSKRFVCSPCGLRRDTIFSQCPRCRAWHSAAFRLRLV